VFFEKCLILNRSFKWMIIKTLLQLMKRFHSTSVGGDNTLALASSVHLAVFPFLDWELDLLLCCFYTKTQTTSEDHVGATVFRRRSGV